MYTRWVKWSQASNKVSVRLSGAQGSLLGLFELVVAHRRLLIDSAMLTVQFLVPSNEDHTNHERRSNGDEEAACTDEVRSPVRGPPLGGPDVGTGNVAQLRDAVDASEANGTFVSASNRIAHPRQDQNVAGISVSRRDQEPLSVQHTMNSEQMGSMTHSRLCLNEECKEASPKIRRSGCNDKANNADA